MEVILWNDKVEKFILGLDVVTKVRVKKTLDVLQEKGNLLGMPDSKPLGTGLFELRTHGRRQVRILYMFRNGKAYVIHGFIKKAWKISKKDIDHGRRIQSEVMRLV